MYHSEQLARLFPKELFADANGRQIKAGTFSFVWDREATTWLVGIGANP